MVDYTYSPEAALLTTTAGKVIAVGIIMPSIASVAVALRFSARRWQRINIEADDWTMLAGALLVGVLGLILIIGSGIGALGLHSPPVDQSKPNPLGLVITRTDADLKAEKIVQAYSIVEKPAFALIKISIFLLYRRIFKSRIMHIVTVVASIVLVLVTITFIILGSLQCELRNWLVWYSGWALRSHCVLTELSTLAFSIVDVVTDIILIAIPAPLVWKLKLSHWRKISVLAIFAIGTSSLVVGIIRMSILFTFTYYGAAGYRDLLGVQSCVITLSLIEAGTGVTAACAPTLRPLIVGLIGPLRSRTKRVGSEHTDSSDDQSHSTRGNQAA